MITFIESGNRIATENFDIGEIYTITYTTGNYRTMCCVGVGSDFVMFQGTMPNALFCLTIGTAETVSTIELGGGGSGTMNYTELENKPQINGIVLIGNKTASDLNLVSQSDLDDYATTASVVSALASKQDTLTTTQLNAVNSGITSSLVTQIGTNTTAISGKQDELTTAQLTAVNSGITTSDVTQITTNKNNISLTPKVLVRSSTNVTGSTTLSDTGVSYVIPSGAYVRISATVRYNAASSNPEEVALDYADTIIAHTVAVSGDNTSALTTSTVIGGYSGDKTIKVKAKTRTAATVSVMLFVESIPNPN